MVDDIQLLVLQDDEKEPTAETPPSDPREPSVPSVGMREGLALLVLAGLLLIGIGVLGGATGKSASLLWLFGSFRLFGGRSSDEEPDQSGSETTTPVASLNEIETPEASETNSDPPAESPAVTRDRPEMSVAKTDGDREVASLVKTLMREGEQQPLPDASGIVAPIRRPLAATLEGIPKELTVLRRDVGPVLVGIAYNETTVSRLADVYDTMLIVAPHYEDSLQEVLKYLPALIQTNGVSGLGSARTFTIPAPEPPGPESESQATLKDLRGHKGEPLHPLARNDPDFLTVSAPPEWTGPARSVLSDYAPVIDIIEWDTPKIHVAGFVFDSAIDLPEHVVERSSMDSEDESSTPAGNDNPPSPETFNSGAVDTGERPETDGGASRSRSGSSTATGTTGPESEGTPLTQSQASSSTDSNPGSVPANQGGNSDESDHDTDSDSESRRPEDGERPAPTNPDGESGNRPESRPEQPEDHDEDIEPDSDRNNQQPDRQPTQDSQPSGSSNPPGPNKRSQPTDGDERSPSQPTDTAPRSHRSGNNDEGSPAPAPDPDDHEAGGDDRSQTPTTEKTSGTDHPSDPTGTTPTDPPEGLPPADADFDFGANTDDDDSSGTTTTSVPPDDAPGDSPARPPSDDGSKTPPGNTPADSSEGVPDDRPVDGNDSGSSGKTSTGAAPGGNPGTAPTSGTGDGSAGQDSSQHPAPSRGAPQDSGARSVPAGKPTPSQTGSGNSKPRSEPGQSPASGTDHSPLAGGSTPPGRSPPASDSGSSSSSSQPDPPYDTGDGPGIVPFGEAPASSDPTVVDVTEHVLNELTFQATATPDREVYATVYADEDGLIRHHHAIDHPDFLKSRRDSITFTPGFFKHLRLLANLRKDIDHRLAGGAHSHPVSGRPKQSPADKQFARKVWRNQRNTAFVIGVNEGSGPDEWTITDDGYEVQRQSNEYLVRIRAFSGTNEPKQIRLHQDMGQ